MYGHIRTYDRAHSVSPQGNQISSTMTAYPTESHYLDTDQPSPCLILLTQTMSLGDDKYDSWKSLIWSVRGSNLRLFPKEGILPIGSSALGHRLWFSIHPEAIRACSINNLTYFPKWIYSDNCTCTLLSSVSRNTLEKSSSNVNLFGRLWQKYQWCNIMEWSGST